LSERAGLSDPVQEVLRRIRAAEEARDRPSLLRAEKALGRRIGEENRAW
jgi:hypothetical protein